MRPEYWPIKLNRIATPYSKRIPLEEAIRITIAWDMPYSFNELKEKCLNSSVLAERLFTRSQTVDWIIDVIGIDGLRKLYPNYKDIARPDLKREIEAFYYKPSNFL